MRNMNVVGSHLSTKVDANDTPDPKISEVGRILLIFLPIIRRSFLPTHILVLEQTRKSRIGKSRATDRAELSHTDEASRRL